jgi:hypothetical protein
MNGFEDLIYFKRKYDDAPTSVTLNQLLVTLEAYLTYHSTRGINH